MQNTMLYGADYYAGEPAVTVNHFGKGRAFFIASRDEARFIEDFVSSLIKSVGIEPIIETPPEVSAQMRHNEAGDWLFLLNFLPEAVMLELPDGWHSVLAGGGETPRTLAPFGADVLHRAA